MNQEITSKDSLNEFEKKSLPTALNVLTILTFVGSGIGFISAIYGFMTSKKTYETMKETIEGGKMDDAPGWAKNMMSPEMLGMYQKMHENRLPILILTLVATALCLYGAMEMRKLKKQGYTFWLIGELLPFGTTILFIGMTAFSGFGLLIALIPLIFIILYTVNKKYLVN